MIKIVVKNIEEEISVVVHAKDDVVLDEILPIISELYDMAAMRELDGDEDDDAAEPVIGFQPAPPTTTEGYADYLELMDE